MGSNPVPATEPLLSNNYVHGEGDEISFSRERTVSPAKGLPFMDFDALDSLMAGSRPGCKAKERKPSAFT